MSQSASFPRRLHSVAATKLVAGFVFVQGFGEPVDGFGGGGFCGWAWAGCGARGAGGGSGSGIRWADFGIGFHRQGDALAGQIDFGDGDHHFLLNLDDFCGVFDEAVGHLADVDEAVLMDADIDEGTERRHVGDDARQLHPGLQIFHFVHALFEGKEFKFLTRVTAGLGQLVENVGESWQTDGFRHVFLWLDFLAEQ
ncbi:hypothetical protein Cflav_PD1906 [Pedosphaera parvula Ellin514]|uniref:Uncharacterized protein n=1 Tax=Pedosphaera parvula (strain Ellin514) TaxID=320771 RepID=B9XLF5_PEDPL|nr:hypothetical protein Cflav_PD1906 [Pedosphaera parvula Ellin514]